MKVAKLLVLGLALGVFFNAVVEAGLSFSPKKPLLAKRVGK